MNPESMVGLCVVGSYTMALSMVGLHVVGSCVVDSCVWIRMCLCGIPVLGGESCARGHLPMREAPRGSRAVEKRTGSCVVGVDMSVVHHAMLCDEPHATFVILYVSSPCTSAGLRLTVVVPLPC